MKLTLLDLNPAVASALEAAFEPWSKVTVLNDSFENVVEFCDCVVSPANSFGLMDGGFDAALTSYFGSQLQRRVQDEIRRRYLGEQPVGSCFIIPTHSRVGGPYFLAHAPTMRVPKAISGTENIYMAMRAVLFTVHEHNTEPRPYYLAPATVKIGSVLCPGLGTLSGGVAPEEAARQMALAYSTIHEVPETITWPYALDREAQVVG